MCVLILFEELYPHKIIEVIGVFVNEAAASAYAEEKLGNVEWRIEPLSKVAGYQEALANQINEARLHLEGAIRNLDYLTGLNSVQRNYIDNVHEYIDRVKQALRCD